ncbi:helix-turn-helix transcriptional regulator [Aquimarina sediminis]|uniref:helix-turn-helix transcriptional regulator n=1 Tax=Aquimarina sediminis TaxID=2070536 RepID=UPI000CA08326|nr:helix-turn-helix transcriptional regulator [Aquimarina sediminis]
MAIEKNEALKKAIGERIRELRIKANYTSYETFALDNDLPRKNYWRLEKGYNFTIETLLRIVSIHDITLEEFFKGIK